MVGVVYAELPEKVVTTGSSNTIPAKKLYHGELHAKVTCQWGNVSRKEDEDGRRQHCEGD